MGLNFDVKYTSFIKTRMYLTKINSFELAKKTGMNRNKLYRIFKNPSDNKLVDLKNICEALGVDGDETLICCLQTDKK